MEFFSQSIFPLAGATADDLRCVCKTLWRWKLCESCEASKDCQSQTCPWQKASRLDAFFQYYRQITAAYVPDFTSHIPALQTHGDLLAIVQDIKRWPDLQRCALTRSHFSHRASARGDSGLPSQNDQNQAFSLAVRIMAMVNSSAEEQMDGGLLESGSMPITWHDDTSFTEFMGAAFVPQDIVVKVTSNMDLATQSVRLSKLTAKRLKKVAGLQLLATNNLQNHLRMDLKRNTVEIYHHTSVLKEHLLAGLNIAGHEETARGIPQ